MHLLLLLCSDMWRYLEHINVLLNGIVRVFSNLPRAQVSSVQLNSNSQLRRRTIKQRGIDTDHSQEYEKIVTTHCNLPYVTNANGELLPGVLVYIMEGVLPLIKV